MNFNKQIVGLDVLRFIAALMVVFYHLAFYDLVNNLGLHGQLPDPLRVLIPLTKMGWIGVEVFFMLSGFVIVYSAQHATAAKFFQQRLTRLWPTAMACASVTACVLLLTGGRNHQQIGSQWIKSVLFSPVGAWIDASYWTLSIEVSFYFVILSLLALKRFHHMPLVMALVGAISTSFWAIASIPSKYPIAHLVHPMIYAFQKHTVLNVLLVRHGCYFAIGVYLWLCLCSEEGWTIFRTLMIALGTIGAALEINYIAGQAQMGTGYAGSSIAAVAIWVAAAGFIIISVKANASIHLLIGSGAATILRRLGLMTYPLYLSHQVMGSLLMAYLSKHTKPLAALGGTVFIMVGFAYLLSVYVEPVLQRACRDLFAGKTKQVEAVGVIATTA